MFECQSISLILKSPRVRRCEYLLFTNVFYNLCLLIEIFCRAVNTPVDTSYG